MDWLKSRGAIEPAETDRRRVLSRARSYRWNEVEGELYLITANAKEVRVPKPEDRLDLVKEYHERSGTLGLQAHGAPAVPDGEF
ncbi:hypothetical protein CYMTET_38193 [Cymbomonas tetramitiformis]|uniref:Uncharacterized protein n=1 Tax=Cymbomonas tetramitiformis TaxID=36881 RepID=A0AAE0CCE1_9CHLO|nr:hypothetical protein CYMTET_38193 [Cymbomonas tetramitiformis]